MTTAMSVTERVEQCLDECPHRPQIGDVFRSSAANSPTPFGALIRIDSRLDRSKTGDEPLIEFTIVEGKDTGLTDSVSELWFTSWDDGPWYELALPEHGPENKQSVCGECGRKAAYNDYLCSRCRGT